jgi:hypothetical protein
MPQSLTAPQRQLKLHSRTPNLTQHFKLDWLPMRLNQNLELDLDYIFQWNQSEFEGFYFTF